MNIPTISQKNGGIESVIDLWKQNKKFWITDSVQEDLEIYSKIKKAFSRYSTKYAVIQHLAKKEGKDVETVAMWVEKALNFQMLTYSDLLLKDFHVTILLERNAEVFRKALKADDLVAMNAANAQYANIIEKFLGTNALIDISKLKIVKQEIAFHPEIAKDLPEYGGAEFNALMDSLRQYKKTSTRQYTDYTDVKDDGGDS